MAVALAVVGIADLASKHLVAARFAIGTQSTLVPHLLAFHVVRNTHGAMGLFGSRPLALIAFAVATATLAFVLLRRTLAESPLAQTGFGMVLGGALGNVVDRVSHGYVIDFLAFPRLSIFNAADAGIAIGLALTVIGACRIRT